MHKPHFPLWVAVVIAAIPATGFAGERDGNAVLENPAYRVEVSRATARSSGFSTAAAGWS